MDSLDHENQSDRDMRKIFICLLLIIAFSISALGLPPQDADKQVIDKFIATQAKQEDGEEYEAARKVVAGDLNRDGISDVAVLYTIEGQNGTNNYYQYLAVFVRSKGRLVPAAHTAVGGKQNREVDLKSVKDNLIYCHTLAYRENDPSSTPSKPGTARFKLVRHKLKEL
jgi:hypothetical protein